jgi:AcrR family transcriptional regulator
MARTQEQRKADTRDRLLRAAADLFARRGVDGVSIDTIADHADRTSGAVYAHFGGKQGLLLGVLDRWTGQAARAMAADFAALRSTRERLLATWTTFTGQREALWLLHELWLRAARDPSMGAALATRYAESRRAMADSYRRWAVEEGVALPLPPRVLATLVFALLLGLDMQRQLDPAAVTDEVALAGFETLFGLNRKDHARAHPDL